jgi:chemotaxis protein histidine kinase CheA
VPETREGRCRMKELIQRLRKRADAAEAMRDTYPECDDDWEDLRRDLELAVEAQAMITAWQDAAASDHAHAQRQAERAEQAEAEAAALRVRAEQERPLRERISELEGALKLAREAVAHAYRRASLGSDAERLYHAAWTAIDAARRAGREGGESQPLPPDPTCPECHGTGDAPNAQFRCPCRWRHLSKAGREGER